MTSKLMASPIPQNLISDAVSQPAGTKRGEVLNMFPSPQKNRFTQKWRSTSDDSWSSIRNWDHPNPDLGLSSWKSHRRGATGSGARLPRPEAWPHLLFYRWARRLTPLPPSVPACSMDMMVAPSCGAAGRRSQSPRTQHAELGLAHREHSIHDRPCFQSHSQ